MNKIALITGITGQDGSYLAELLISKGYSVHGIIRRHSNTDGQSSRLDHMRNVKLHYGDVLDWPSLVKIMSEVKPDEIYHLAAQSHVQVSFEVPSYTLNVNAQGTLNVLEAIRQCKMLASCKLYNAASSEMFGNCTSNAVSTSKGATSTSFEQNIFTPMHPVSPYGASKLAAYNLCNTYRESYGLRVWNGILFNHESPRRGNTFVTKKVVDGLKQVVRDLRDGYPPHCLALGNLDAARDWGHAKDYVAAMVLMLDKCTPGNYVCATGDTNTVGELCKTVWKLLGQTGNVFDYISQDPKYFRPNELNFLRGNAEPLKNITGWEPTYTFETLIEDMINN